MINSIQSFLFSFALQSNHNHFKIYISSNDNFMQIFPKNNKNLSFFLNINFSEIKKTIEKNLNSFFSLFSQTDYENKETLSHSVFNQILTKILLENNHDSKLNDGLKTVLIISDCEDSSKIIIDSKLLYLLKTNKIKVDTLHIGKREGCHNLINIAFYNGGIFDNIEKNESNILNQTLLMEYLPIVSERNNKNQIIPFSEPNEEFKCEICNKKDKILVLTFKRNLFICLNCYKPKEGRRNSGSFGGNINNSNISINDINKQLITEPFSSLSP